MKTINFSIALFSFVGFLVLGCQPSSKSKVTEFEASIDSIFSFYNDQSKPGAAVAVVKDGKIVFSKGYGSANLEYDIPVTPQTIFHIASVSKQFTAFSILLLADEGELNFDDDIRKYIPEVPDFGKTITLRHLASHTSGLRDQWNLLAMAGWRLDDVITREHVLKLVAKQKALNFDPGEKYTYCNTGFTLLAEVVARVSGMSFAEFTKSRIFDPLEMSNTLFYDDHERIVKNRAYSYYIDGSGYKKSVLSYANVGATSLFTTVEDLSLWAMNFESPKVGNSKIIEQLNTLAVLNNGETFGGAYGQFVDQYKGLNQIQHGGADAGYRTYLGRFPDQKFAVVVFSNFANSNPGGLALQVADLYLKDKQTIAESIEPTEVPASITLSTEVLNTFTGDYWNEVESYSRKIYIKNDTLHYSRGEGNVSLLVPIDNTTFQMLDVPSDLKVKFENENGQKKMIVSMNNENPSTFENYIPTSYSTNELQQFTGTFYSEELSTAYSIVVKDDKLIVTHPRHSDFAITPIKKDLFSGDPWFFGLIQFERNTSNVITGMKVSSGRVSGLYFQKEF